MIDIIFCILTVIAVSRILVTLYNYIPMIRYSWFLLQTVIKSIWPDQTLLLIDDIMFVVP